MNRVYHPKTIKEISCRVTCTLLLYVREKNNGTLDSLLDGFPLDETYLSDTNNWVSHALLQILYHRMIGVLGDDNAVYHMALASERFQSLGILDRIVRLLGSPRLIYSQAPKYNRFLKLNGSVHLHEIGESWAVLEDRYHDSTQKTRFDCDYTRGILAGIPTLFGLPLAEVEEIKCQVAHEKYGHRVWPDHPLQGCPGCFYRVKWISKKIPFLKQFFLGDNYYRQAIEDLVQANRLIQAKYDEVKHLIKDLQQANRELIESKHELVSQKNELIESERRYRILAENVSDTIWVIDFETLTFEYISPSVEKARGFTPDEAMALNLEQTLSPQSLAKVTEILETELANEGKPSVDPHRFIAIEFEHSIKGGGYAWAEATVSFVRDQAGSPTAIMWVTRDISERKKAEQLIVESEEKYRSIVQYAPAGICELDLETLRFTSVNDIICEYTGYSRSEVLELDPYAFCTEGSKETLTRLVDVVVTQQPQELSTEFEAVGKNKRVFWVLANTRLFYEKGVPKRAMAVVHDLTETRKAEAEKRNLEVKLQNAKKLESLGTLAGGVAHDLNNILSGIVSYPDLLLLDIDKDSPFIEPLLTIKQSGLKASAIVQDLLTLARRNVVTKKVVDLNTLVNNFIASPECQKMAGDQPGITIETHLSDGITNVFGSETHLFKTVMNLVSNAVDAMPSGGVISIDTRDCYLDQPYMALEVIPKGEYAILEVSDTGIGIPGSDLDKIFEPFYTNKKMGRSGTGLGMSVVWGTVKDHDGHIDISTEEGSGTTFTLYFPISRSDIVPSPSIHIDDYLGKGESILIVDDAAEQRDLAKRMMQRLGYKVKTAANGKEALALIREGTYELLILDMIMPPGMDGLETYRKILEIVPGQKAIIASGYSQTESVQEAQRLGAGRYIKKPFTLQKIGLAARYELDRR